jgi:hypothetical protein
LVYHLLRLTGSIELLLLDDGDEDEEYDSDDDNEDYDDYDDEDEDEDEMEDQERDTESDDETPSDEEDKDLDDEDEETAQSQLSKTMGTPPARLACQDIDHETLEVLIHISADKERLSTELVGIQRRLEEEPADSGFRSQAHSEDSTIHLVCVLTIINFV